MVSTTETTNRGVVTEGDGDPYQVYMYAGMGGRAGRHGGDGAVFGGGGPGSEGPGQLYLQGDLLDDPPGGPPDGGGFPGGGGGDADPNPHPQIRAPAVPAHGSLKGTPPAIFNGNRKMIKQYTQEFTLY